MPVHDYAALSYWLEDVGDLDPRPSLDGSTSCDVAVVGAGFSGLWTAYYLLRNDPGLKVVVLEREIAGFGGSGRNAGWCNATMLGVTPRALTKKFGAEGAREMLEVLRGRLGAVSDACSRENIDAHFRHSGVLRIARGRHELPALATKWDELDALGLADGVLRLDRDETRARIDVQGAEAGLFDPNVAWVHPGRLVRGLAEAVERNGGTIYERTPVTSVAPGPRPKVATASGVVDARNVVLASEAYTTELPGSHRQLIPLYSLVVLTEPLSDAQWAEIGWNGGEGLSSCCLTVDYLSRTHDGRILFGGRGAPYHFGSRIDGTYDRHRGTHDRLRGHLVSWFPSLADVRITHEWGGPLGVPRDWMPNVFHDRATGLAGAYGYTGQGVAMSNLAGQALADRLTGKESRVGRLPLIDHRSRSWEPEPLRWTAVRALQASLFRTDARGERTGRPPSGRSIAERLTSH